MRFKREMSQQPGKPAGKRVKVSCKLLINQAWLPWIIGANTIVFIHFTTAINNPVCRTAQNIQKSFY